MPTDELDQLDFVFDSLSKHLTKDERPGLLEMPGIKPEQVAGFYRAAAGFYQRAPWRKLGYETAIKVECDKFESGPWYAVVMGQSGLTFGVSLYEDLNILREDVVRSNHGGGERQRDGGPDAASSGTRRRFPSSIWRRVQETRLGRGGTGGVPVDLSQGAGNGDTTAVGLGT